MLIPKAQTTQTWMEASDPEFIKVIERPSCCPDFNALDYKLCDDLETMILMALEY